jgi:hypothetical protein
VILDKSRIVGHVVEVMKIVVENSRQNHSFLMLFLLEITNCRTFSGSDENSWTEVCLESFVSYVILAKCAIVGHFVEFIEIIERKSNKVDSFVAWSPGKVVGVEWFTCELDRWGESLFDFYFGYEILHYVNNCETFFGERRNSRMGSCLESITINVILVQIIYRTTFLRSHQKDWTELSSDSFTTNVISHDADARMIVSIRWYIN